MRVTLRQRDFCDWPGSIRRRLRALTIRDWSGMREALRYHNDELLTFVLFEGKLPVAWSLVEFDRLDKMYNIMVYVRRDRRRNGYGKRVFTAARQWVMDTGREYFVYPDPENYKFFKSMGEKTYGL